MPDTFGSIRTEILGWMRGDLRKQSDSVIVNSAINNAVESIWNSMILVQLGRFMGADVPKSISLPAGAERVLLVSVADPTVALTVGTQVIGALAGRTITAYYTLVTESGSETLPSPLATQIVAANSVFTARLTNQANISGAIGWNIYTTTSPDTVPALQNNQPIPFGQTWIEPQDVGVTDYPDFQTLMPSVNNTGDNISWIAHMEIRTSSGGLRAWNRSNIDSMMMRRFASSLPTASEFQNIAWDLINGNQLEFRPSAGIAFNPRIFYIVKPRRLRYDQAPIPYSNISGMNSFIVASAVSDLKLGVDEYLASTAWGQKATTTRLEIQMALAQEDWNKDIRITPHM